MADLYREKLSSNDRAHLMFVGMCEDVMHGIKEPISDASGVSRIKIFEKRNVDLLLQAARCLELQNHRSRWALYRGEINIRGNPLQFVLARVSVYWFYIEICARIEEAIIAGIKCEETYSLIGEAFNEIFKMVPDFGFVDLKRSFTNLGRCYKIRSLIGNERGDPLLCASLAMCQELSRGTSLRCAREIVDGKILKMLLSSSCQNAAQTVRKASHTLLLGTIFSQENLKLCLEEVKSGKGGTLLDVLLNVTSENCDEDMITGLCGIDLFVRQIKKLKDAPDTPESLDLVVSLLLEKLLNLEPVSKDAAEKALKSIVLATDKIAGTDVLKNSSDALYRFTKNMISIEGVDVSKLEKVIVQCSFALGIECYSLLIKEVLRHALRECKEEFVAVFTRIAVKFMGLNGMVDLLCGSSYPDDTFTEALLTGIIESVIAELRHIQPNCITDAFNTCIKFLASRKLISLCLIVAMLRSEKCADVAERALHGLIDVISFHNMDTYPSIIFEVALYAILTAFQLYPSECLEISHVALAELPFYLTLSPKCSYLSASAVMCISDLSPSSNSSDLIYRILTIIDTNSTITWAECSDSFTERTASIALWNAVINHLPGIDVYCDAHVIDLLTSIIVSHICIEIDISKDSVVTMSLHLVEKPSFHDLNRISISYVSRLIGKIITEHETSQQFSLSPNVSILLKRLASVPTMRLKDCISANFISVLQTIAAGTPSDQNDSDVLGTLSSKCICLCNCLCALSAGNLSLSSDSSRKLKRLATDSDSVDLWIASATKVFFIIDNMPLSPELEAALHSLLAEVSRCYSWANLSASLTRSVVRSIQVNISYSNKYIAMLRLEECTYLSNLTPELVDDTVIQSIRLLLEKSLDYITMQLSVCQEEGEEDLIIDIAARIALICLRMPHIQNSRFPETGRRIKAIGNSLLMALEVKGLPVPFLSALRLVELIKVANAAAMPHLIFMYLNFPEPDLLSRAADDSKHNYVITASNEIVSRIISISSPDSLSEYLLGLDEQIRLHAANLPSTSLPMRSKAASAVEGRIYGLVILSHSVFNFAPPKLPNLGSALASIIRSLHSVSTLLPAHVLVRVFDFERRVARLRHLALRPSDARTILNTCVSALIASLLPNSLPNTPHGNRSVDAFNSLCALLASIASRRPQLVRKSIPSLIIILRLLMRAFMVPSVNSRYHHSSLSKFLLPLESAREVLLFVTALKAKLTDNVLSVKKKIPEKVLAHHLTFLLSSVFSMQNRSLSFNPECVSVINDIIASLVKMCPKSCVDTAISTIPASSPEREILKSLLKELDRKHHYKGQF